MPSVLAVGEVLWDVFPEGAQFGGAPANFACAVASLGGGDFHVAVASGVGEDDWGRRAVRSLADRNVDPRFVAWVHDRPTGQVIVSRDDLHQPAYRFIENPAWDAIPSSPSLEDWARRADALYFGTLGQRAEASRRTIRELVGMANPVALRVCDVNIRPPHATAEVILDSLAMANIVKLNEDELPIVSRLLGLGGSTDDRIRALMTRYSLRALTLTCGAAGSRIVRADGASFGIPAMTVTVADPVGAGDAYTAALVIGWLRGWPVERIGRWAATVSAYVCTQRGGTPVFPEPLRADVAEQSATPE
jgi:fructokinase